MNTLIAAAVLALAVIPSALAGSMTCTHGIVRRKEFAQLSSTEVQDLFGALNQARQRKSSKELSFWDQLAKTHYEHNNYIHGNPLFLPWHRYFVAFVEQELQRLSNKAIALPYWNWDVDSEAPEHSAVWTPNNFGTNGKDGQCVQDGVFANQQAIIPDSHCLQRDWSESSGIGKLSSVDEIAAIISRQQDYDSFRQTLEGIPHGTVHVNIGGDMAVMNSPNDPVFFLHHAKIDKIWWDWQNVYGFDNTLYGGDQAAFTRPGGRRGDVHSASLNDKLTPFNDWTVSEMFTTEPLCYTYADVNVRQAVPNMAQANAIVNRGTKIVPPPVQKKVDNKKVDGGDNLSVSGHPHLSKIHDFFHNIFNAAPEDPSGTGLGVSPETIPGLNPVDKTVTVHPAVAADAGDRTELLLLRTHKPLPEKWLLANSLNVEKIRKHEHDTSQLIFKLNNIPGFVSHSALWNKPTFVAKIATTGKVQFKATINKAAIAVEIKQQRTDTLLVPAEVHKKIKLTLGVDALQDIAGVKDEVLKVLGGTGGFPADSINNPLSDRMVAPPSTV